MSEPSALALPSESERGLYFAVLEQGGRVPFREVSEADAPSVLRLLELGLLVHHTEDASLTAVNPRSVGERISTRLRAEGTRMLVQAEQMPALLGELTEAYDSSPRKVARSSEVQHVDDKEEIRHRILQLQADCRAEVLLAQPGARPAAVLVDERERQRARLMLENGVRAKLLYQPTARADEATAEYAATMSGWGMKVRILTEPFARMLVFDRTVAVIPAAADHSSAAFIEDPAVVAFLVGVFERDWERAERARWRTGSSAAGPAHDQVGRLLAQGLTQRVIATRLGLSERTVAGHISRLRELHDAETLFQLGWQMRGSEVPPGE
ncbi:LuxR C-terminal-related transcriptional regulator [Kitasatospora sp. NPDC056138]|uniref:LuxR C-terminal-related transcriptional regulator n=1 Tax=Kitasatospora sp. NPDC056138 TaxID=3345724 RepID=UPI0035DD76E2